MSAKIDFSTIDIDEQYTFSSKSKRQLLMWMGIGLALFGLGIGLAYAFPSHHAPDPIKEIQEDKEQMHMHVKNQETQETFAHYAVEEPSEGGHGGGKSSHAEGGEEGGHHGPTVLHRIFANLWLNINFFMGLAVIGVFFIAVHYAGNAGWYALVKRPAEAMGQFMPIAGVLMLVVFLAGSHYIFHWTHSDLFDPESPKFDPILAGKENFLNPYMFVGVTVLIVGLWYLMHFLLRQYSHKEDAAPKGETKWHFKSVKVSVIFLVLFGTGSLVTGWAWLMSIDPHWFSTLYSWYVFASWFVSGLATLTLIVVYLKEQGYLKAVNENHLHDLGKFMFAFSIFWTYLWFVQFMIYYYSNIPEETVYFYTRMTLWDGKYKGFFFVTFFINFIFPFLALMTRDAKRKLTLLKIVGVAILIGHWLDFYLMIMPGTVKHTGNMTFLELGLLLFFISLFVYVVKAGLAKGNLIPKNHPMLNESLAHDI